MPQEADFEETAATEAQDSPTGRRSVDAFDETAAVPEQQRAHTRRTPSTRPIAIAKQRGTTTTMLKCVVLGSSNVGKSSLLERYTKNSFRPERRVTLGADFASKVIDVGGERVRLVIWDTAGQERFHHGTIGGAFYRGADGALLVYDTTDFATFAQVELWRRERPAAASTGRRRFRSCAWATRWTCPVRREIRMRKRPSAWVRRTASGSAGVGLRRARALPWPVGRRPRSPRWRTRSGGAPACVTKPPAAVARRRPRAREAAAATARGLGAASGPWLVRHGAAAEGVGAGLGCGPAEGLAASAVVEADRRVDRSTLVLRTTAGARRTPRRARAPRRRARPSVARAASRGSARSPTGARCGSLRPSSAGTSAESGGEGAERRRSMTATASALARHDEESTIVASVAATISARRGHHRRRARTQRRRRARTSAVGTGGRGRPKGAGRRRCRGR